MNVMVHTGDVEVVADAGGAYWLRFEVYGVLAYFAVLYEVDLAIAADYSDLVVSLINPEDLDETRHAAQLKLVKALALIKPYSTAIKGLTVDCI